MNVLAFDTCLGAVSVAVRWQGAGGEWLMRDRYEVREQRPRRAADADDRRGDAGGGACLLRPRAHRGDGRPRHASPACAAAWRRRAGWRWRQACPWSAPPALPSWRIRPTSCSGRRDAAACWRWPSMPAAAWSTSSSSPSAQDAARAASAACARGRRGPPHRRAARHRRRLGRGAGRDAQSAAAGGEAEATLADLQPDARSLACWPPTSPPSVPAAALSAAARRQAAGRPLLAASGAP